MKLTHILFLAFICTIFITYSCEKDPEIITETVTVTDTLVVTQVDTVFIPTVDTFTIIELMPDTATTFILLRHAETTGAGSDPNLSATGMVRADELAHIMGSISLDAIYSTNFNRTMQTASPVAADQGLSIQTYSGSNLNSTADEILANYPAGKILVVGIPIRRLISSMC